MDYMVLTVHEAIAISIKELTVRSIKTPTAIPTSVPLKPYNPFFISSQSYPEIRAVNVLIMLPLTANRPICHEFKKIPININNPDNALFWNMTCPMPRPKISNDLRVKASFMSCRMKMDYM